MRHYYSSVNSFSEGAPKASSPNSPISGRETGRFRKRGRKFGRSGVLGYQDFGRRRSDHLGDFNIFTGRFYCQNRRLL